MAGLLNESNSGGGNFDRSRFDSFLDPAAQATPQPGQPAPQPGPQPASQSGSPKLKANLLIPVGMVVAGVLYFAFGGTSGTDLEKAVDGVKSVASAVQSAPVSADTPTSTEPAATQTGSPLDKLLVRQLPMKAFLTDKADLVSSDSKDFDAWKRAVERLIGDAEKKGLGKPVDAEAHQKLVDFVVFSNKKIPIALRTAHIEDLELLYTKFRGQISGYDDHHYSGNGVQAHLNRTAGKRMEDDKELVRLNGVRFKSKSTPIEFAKTLLESHRSDIRRIGAIYLMLNSPEETKY